MATTAILSALEQEQQGLLGQLAQARRVRRAGRDFWRGTLQGTPVVLALSRIGKVAAATTATTLIEAFDATRIVFTGVAGGLGPQVQVGDMVVASHFVQHDMDASPLFPRFEIPLYQRTQFACDPHLTRQLARACRDAIDGLPPVSAIGRAPATPTVHQGLVASGDRFIATAQTSREVRHALRAQSMDALAVEMEGGAVAQSTPGASWIASCARRPPRPLVEPASAPEKPHRRDRADHHQRQGKRVAERPLKPRHETEIRPVGAGRQRGRQQRDARGSADSRTCE